MHLLIPSYPDPPATNAVAKAVDFHANLLGGSGRVTVSVYPDADAAAANLRHLDTFRVEFGGVLVPARSPATAEVRFPDLTSLLASAHAEQQADAALTTGEAIERAVLLALPLHPKLKGATVADD